MEFWFVMTVISTILIGCYGFMHKVAAHHGFDTSLFTVYANISATAFGLAAVFFYSSFTEWVHLILAFALLNGLLHTVSQIIRVDALRYIDATIFFPLYKLVGPLLMVIVAIIFFAERFNGYEWLGIILSLFVPLLLISKSEKYRQNNLSKGLLFMFYTVLLTTVAGAMNKVAVDLGFDIYLYIMLSTFIGILYSSGQYMFNHRKENIKQLCIDHTSKSMVWYAALSGFFQYAGFITYMRALEEGASLGIAFTIQSLYILIPIVLAIIFYKEHWNARKAVAIVASILALGLMR